MDNDKNCNCVVLIGMPGAGKSTLGILLAKSLSKDFVDTDILLQLSLKNSLQNYLDRYGYQKLRQQEQNLILHSNFKHQVISTGGSVVYSHKAMAMLKTLGPLVYLDISYDTLLQRVQDVDTRGLACPKHYSLRDLYDEREILYRKYADIIIDNNRLTQIEAIKRLRDVL